MSGIASYQPSSSQANQTTTTENVGASDQAASTVSGTAASGGSSINEGTINQSLDPQFAKALFDYTGKLGDGAAQAVLAQSNLTAGVAQSALASQASLAQGTQTGGLSVLIKPALYIAGAVAALLLILMLKRK